MVNPIGSDRAQRCTVVAAALYDHVHGVRAARSDVSCWVVVFFSFQNQISASVARSWGR